MLEAFKKLGCKVTIISGSTKERRGLISEFRIRSGDFDLCYSEPSTYPVHPIWDYLFYTKVRRAGIPIGIYYRDAYWKISPEWLPQKAIKKIQLQIRYRSDLWLFTKVAEVMYFPSQSLAEFFTAPQKEVLPPGATIRFENDRIEKIPEPLTIIYVGSLLPRYGLTLLLDTMEKLNGWRLVNLNLICPPENLSHFPEIFANYLDKPWLRLNHTYGSGLDEHYQKATIGIIPRPVNTYNNLAMPVKLFEYLSYGLPIVVTNCKEMAAYISRHRCGKAVSDDSTALAQAIISIISEPENYAAYATAARTAVLNGNLWTDRAKKIVDTLLHT